VRWNLALIQPRRFTTTKVRRAWGEVWWPKLLLAGAAGVIVSQSTAQALLRELRSPWSPGSPPAAPPGSPGRPA
jgi:hypothetical protein